VIAGCGAGQPSPEAPPPEPPAEPAPVLLEEPAAEAPAEAPAEPPAEVEEPLPPADMKFVDMSKGQRKTFMKQVVLPQMTKVFQDFDKEHFAEVTCLTCHNEGAKQGDFTMPNPDLPKLNPAKNFAAHKKEHAKLLTFMMKKVAPEMVTLLKADPYNPKTQTGFGCFNCHTMAQ
jgi:hypothetical protein